MQRTNLYLDERQTSALDRLAHAQGVSRAEVVRRLVDRSMAADSVDLDGDLDAITGAFGVLRDEEWDGRGPDDRSAHLDRLASG